MAYNGFAIDKYPDAAEICAKLDRLKDMPIYGVTPEALIRYEVEYFDQKCPRSKEMISEAKSIIPGGVQHNLAFNYPFPIVITKAEGAKLYDIDGNEYYDLLQAGVVNKLVAISCTTSKLNKWHFTQVIKYKFLH